MHVPIKVLCAQGVDSSYHVETNVSVSLRHYQT